jgi:membrane protein implicated in regulation of membrane protease activity
MSVVKILELAVIFLWGLLVGLIVGGGPLWLEIAVFIIVGALTVVFVNVFVGIDEKRLELLTPDPTISSPEPPDL